MSASAPPTVVEASRSEAAAVPAIELPTFALIIFVYGCWLTLTHAYGDVPTWILAPCIAVLLTLHSSMQHEILHGHPTRSAAINRLFGIVPLSLWLPYDRYRRSHLVHHINDRLTDPVDDPESNYWTPTDWNQLSPLKRHLFEMQLTLSGRMFIGSWWRMGHFVRREVQSFVRNDHSARKDWLVHFTLCVPVIYWVTIVCGIPFWLYVVAMIVPGNAILLIRSFAEHRAFPGMQERTALIENSWLLGPLFLFNNLHSLHHAEPLLPWYRYNARYRLTRERLIAENGGLVYSTYFDVARRFLLRPHDQPQHPMGRVPSRRAV
jgi:fatty acid desaturase